MKILLINICLRYDSPIKYIPVGLSAIATALDRAGFHPDIFDIDLYRYSDSEIDDFLRKNNGYDLVGMGNIVSGYKHTKKLAAKIKEFMPSAILVVGNTVATSVPELLLRKVPQVDIAVIGEGDKTVVELVTAISEKKSWNKVPGIAYIEDGGVVITEKRKAIPDMSYIPFPDYSLFEVGKYIEVSNITISEPRPPIPFKELRALPLNTARGCPFDCSFCSNAFKGYKYRYYPVKMVVRQIAELQKKYNINYIHFWDDLTIFSAERLRELCDEIEKANLRFYWELHPRPDTFTMKDVDLLKRSKDLGAMIMGGALESADDGILKAMNKKLKIERYAEQAKAAEAAGLRVLTSIVLGYPQETRETIKKTIGFCRELGVYPSVGFILPLPGTPIYRYALEHKYIIDEEEYLLSIADRQDMSVNLTKMSDEEFFTTVKDELIALKNDLGISIPDDEVIKTGVYKVARSARKADAAIPER